MNCQEVIETMHRDLDGDLSSGERQDMLVHFRSCSECEAVYKRLQSLSLELEQLPKVAPPFSLVDSILPRLDEIEAEQSGTVPGHKPDPVTTQPALLPQRGTQRSTGRMKRWNWPAAFGTAAAGVMIGLFIIANPPQLGGGSNNDSAANSAAMDTNSASEGAKNETFSRDKAAPATDSMVTQDQSGPLAADSLKSDSTLDKKFTATEPSENGKSAPSSNAGQAMNKEYHDNTAAASGNTGLKDTYGAPIVVGPETIKGTGNAEEGSAFKMTTQEDTDQSSTSEVEATDSKEATKEAPKEDSPPPEQEGSNEALNDGTEADVELNTDAGSNAADSGGEVQPGVSGLDKVTDAKKKAVPHQTITLTLGAETPSVLTTDGLYAAAVTSDNRIVLYETLSRKALFLSPVHIGTLELHTWSEDGHTFEYTVMAEESKATYVVDRVLQQETNKK
ncbi:hypothetical protein SY83_14510 [Paenibacillus swuensis]|uniref:Putative zinc-finger domain-containing protein n=1 Tax=Paenibacillus swuensis TaxID=1178515 RepID=A0A172TJS0_9BACL|nr:zf-HC2 domain-containing protein [Paenibacillus swuensis]ANE47278.1 hypothetical protein SY83_14510 [Paenibacillus swuensis]